MRKIKRNRIEAFMLIMLTLIFAFGVTVAPVHAASIKAPARVANVKIKSVSTTSIKVTWKKVSNAKGYQIYRKTTSSNWKKVGSVKGASKKTFVNGQLKPNTKYYYKVRAYTTYKSKGKTKYKYEKFSKTVPATTKEVAFTVDLKEGFYTAGIDVPAGSFDVVAVAGVGYILSDEDSANLRGPEYKRDDFWDFDDYSRSYNNYKLKEGEILEVTGVQIRCYYSYITANASPREYDEEAGIKLTPGYYKVGTDISSGRYCIKFLSGEGGFVSSDREEGDCIVNANMDGDPETGEYVDYVSNIILQEGETIEVTPELEVLFIPEK